jgi:hypothetical protein
MSRLLAAALMLATTAAPLHARTLEFAGRTWHVRDAAAGAPGPNAWSQDNAWVDELGRLHLRIDRVDGVWRCAEVVLDTPLGAGTYEFRVVGRVDRLDRNVVFGLFSYPDPTVGSDLTHEIDIEFARWGDPAARAGHWTVYPTTAALAPVTQAFDVALEGSHSTHRFHRGRDTVRFQMLHGHQDGDAHEAAGWTYAPRDARRRISRAALPLHLNLWLFRGQAPSDGQPVEVIVSDFRLTPAE